MKSRKLVALLLLLVMVTVATGCGTSPSVGNEQSTPPSSSTDPSSSENTERTEQITLSLFIPSRIADSLYTMETPTLKALGEKFNVNFKIDTVFSREVHDKFQFMVASGDIPDIVAANIDDINRFAISGAFRSLDDMIASSAPNIKKYLIDNKAAYAQAAATDNKVYAIPMLSAVRTAMGYNIRMDWLEKLNLDVPVTIDDWYNVLKAFRDNDPNGNNIKDEVPLVLDNAWEAYFMNFADAWGIELNVFNDYWMVKDGELVYAPLLPEAKEFIGTYAKWYDEGLIDREFLTREDTNNYHILQDIAGATCYWTGFVAAQNELPEVKANDPNTNWQVIPPPVLNAGQKPRTFSQQLDTTTWSWAMSGKTQYADDIIKIFDYVYSDEGSMLFNFGIENDTYEIVNGVPQYTSKVTGYEKGTMTYIRENGMQALIGMRQLPEYEKAMCQTPDVAKQLFDYVENDYFYDPTPRLVLTEEDNDAYQSLFSAIETYTTEELTKFIIGQRPMSEYDDFINKVNSMNIEQAKGYMEKAYQRYLELVK